MTKKFFYEINVENKVAKNVYACNHPLYNKCTLYLQDGKGLAVIQQRFNPKMKTTWWSAIDIGLVDDILNNENFQKYFNQHAAAADERGLYPTVAVRQLMWALKMRPLKKEFWETRF